ncbi:hypothetical protein BAE44_0007166 [Dichanthelium oligosanthes]|uniref:Sodium/calcium exchanger membrane region domain-containing protein n=1 Tax=Dichanthelium oligosanthes TaxID=888268 RepID=A0A1E5W3D4_9POAL|nr:hypothetical protein BAE44_0007166 [Dichanthelium oligosanthes]
MAAVTLLALGNGAPDAFASAAALGGPGGMPRAGLAAILSAGAFVSAFVVGAVALIAAPFAVPPASFARDVFFYLLAASGLFYIYLSAEIFLWQAVGLVLFYVFFVGLVFYMDLGGEEGKAVSTYAAELEMANGIGHVAKGIGRVAMDLPLTVEDHKQQDPALCTLLRKFGLKGETSSFLRTPIPCSSYSGCNLKQFLHVRRSTVYHCAYCSNPVRAITG